MDSELPGTHQMGGGGGGGVAERGGGREEGQEGEGGRQFN